MKFNVEVIIVFAWIFGLWLNSVQTEESEQSKNRFVGVMAEAKNAHSNHELTMNGASERETEYESE